MKTRGIGQRGSFNRRAGKDEAWGGIGKKLDNRMVRFTRREVGALERSLMKRTATAVWAGDLKTGKGKISTETGVLKDTQYSFGSRFENGIGTNPEELLAAAHAGCFSMAFSAQLGEAGLTAERIDVTATITLDKTETGFGITESHLD